MSFTKLDAGIVNSSIWSEPPSTRVLWITMLAMSDESGFVACSEPGLVRAANIQQAEFNEAIKTLENPDSFSRTSEHDGRRVEKIEGGWVILNYIKYRIHSEKIKEQTRERVRRFRDKKSNVTQCNVTDTLPSASSSSSSSDLSICIKEGINKGGVISGGSVTMFDTFWKLYPKKVGKQATIRAWFRIKPIETIGPLIFKSLEWQVKTEEWIKDDGKYIPKPENYLCDARWEDEPVIINKPETVSESAEAIRKKYGR